MKNKIIKFLILFLGIIFIASFALAEDDNQYEGDDIYQPVATTAAPVIPTVATPVVSPVTPVTPTPTVVTEIPQVTISSTLIDSDSDGVIDSLDKYPGEDDFAYNGEDANNNGIIDELEYLAAR